jgi:hypothetical protein
MADLETGLVAFLKADGAVAALVGTRIYRELLPQEVAFPAISYGRVSTERRQQLAGPESFTNVTIQIDCHANSSASVIALADAVIARLDGVTGAMGGATIQHGYYEQRSDLSDADGDLVRRRITLDFVFILHE